MTDTIASINDLQNSIYDIQKKISELNTILLQNNISCNLEVEELIKLLDKEINHSYFEEPFNKLMALGNQIINS